MGKIKQYFENKKMKAIFIRRGYGKNQYFRSKLIKSKLKDYEKTYLADILNDMYDNIINDENYEFNEDAQFHANAIGKLINKLNDIK